MFDQVGSFSEVLTAISQFLARRSLSDWISLASAILAFIAFLYGLAVRRSERRIRNLENQVSRVDSELIAWGVRCVDAMSRGHMLLATRGSGRQPGEARILRDEIQSALSALVDMGRLYFPNRSPDLEGTDRPPAFRGFRPAILDAVMLVHEELKHASIFDNEDTERAADNINGARRIFISEFQEEIDRFRDPQALKELRTTDDDWTEMTKLVDDYEKRLGAVFWKRRPRPHHQLLAEWAKGRMARSQVG